MGFNSQQADFEKAQVEFKNIENSMIDFLQLGLFLLLRPTGLLYRKKTFHIGAIHMKSHH